MIWIVPCCILLWLAVSFAAYLVVFYNRKKDDDPHNVISGPDYEPYYPEMHRLIDKALEVPFEWVETEASDGKRLAGRLCLQDPSKPFRIEFHGYRGHAIRDFSGGLLFSLKQGFNVLAVDERGQGRSYGHTMTFGIKERLDVPVWIRYLQHRFGEDVPIYLDGISMGGATVLMASDAELPGNIRGIWADCPFSSPFGIIRDVAAKLVPFPQLAYPFIITGAFLFGRFNLFETTALKAVKNAKYPIAVIHGTGDHFVPAEMSRELVRVNPEIFYTEVEGAPHGLSYIVDFDAYERAYLDFVKKTEEVWEK